MAGKTLQVAIPIFEHVAALDAVGPYDVLGLLPGANVVFVSDKPGTYFTAGKETSRMGLTATSSFQDVDKPDIILVPGGPPEFLPLQHQPLLDWIRKVHETTLYTTSVCTGSLILASAGVLNGVEAVTHWSAFEILEKLGAKASDSPKRYVQQGKIITAAGVSAGIDMALYLASVVSDERTAKGIQLLIEYDPQPPFDCGSVEKANPELVNRAYELLKM